MEEGDIIDKYAVECTLGVGAFHDQANGYRHPFSAIDEICDNNFDESLSGKTTQMRLTIDYFKGRRQEYATKWSFVNDGNPISKSKMLKVFSFADSKKDEDVYVGRYGVGLKAAADYLGNSLCVASYNPVRQKLVIGFYCFEMLKKNKQTKLKIFVVEIDSTSTQLSQNNIEQLEIICKYTTFKTPEQLIETAHNEISRADVKETGGTCVWIFTKKTKWIEEFAHILSFEKNDISTCVPWGNEKFERITNPPRFAVSLRDHLSILYFNDGSRPPFDIYLFGDKIHRIDFSKEANLYMGIFNKNFQRHPNGYVSPKDIEALNWYPVAEAPEPYSHKRNVQKAGRYGNNENKPRRVYDVNYYFFQRRKSIKDVDVYKNPVMRNFDLILVYKNDRLVHIEDRASLREKKLYGFGVVRSNCFATDSKKQMVHGTGPYIAAMKRVDRILNDHHYTMTNPIIPSRKIKRDERNSFQSNGYLLINNDSSSSSPSKIENKAPAPIILPPQSTPPVSQQRPTSSVLRKIIPDNNNNNDDHHPPRKRVKVVKPVKPVAKKSHQKPVLENKKEEQEICTCGHLKHDLQDFINSINTDNCEKQKAIIHNLERLIRHI